MNIQLPGLYILRVCRDRAHQLLDNGLDEFGEVEPLVGLAIPDVLAQDGDDFGVGVGVEVVTALDQDVLELLVCVWSVRAAREANPLTVGNDTICVSSVRPHVQRGICSL